MTVRCIGYAAIASALFLAACGSEGPAEAAAIEGPTIVVSTNILGDVVEHLVGDAAAVVTIMPVGADPHDFQPSAQQITQLSEADAVIMNGGGFEEGLIDVVESAEADGVIVFEAMSVVDTLEFGAHDHGDEHGDEHADHEGEDGHGDEHADHEGEDGHGDEHADHEGEDPHFFSDPVRMATAAMAISEFLITEVDGIDQDAVSSATDDYLAELETLNDDIEAALSGLSDSDRVLVTNHEVLSYFADQYGFEVIGTVIPGGSTADGANAEALSELAAIVEAEGVPAVFSDASSSDELAQTLALEVGDIAVVELYSESLGPEGSDGSTYLDMMLVNAERIAAALAG